jgi:hypothetical protein
MMFRLAQAVVFCVTPVPLVFLLDAGSPWNIPMAYAAFGALGTLAFTYWVVRRKHGKEVAKSLIFDPRD